MKRKRSIELGFVFGLPPILLASPVPFEVSVSLAILFFIYVIFISIKSGYFKKTKSFFWSSDFRFLGITVRFLLFAVLTLIAVYLKAPEYLFKVILKDIFFWMQFCLIYVFLSVIPQELIYRYFFRNRYFELFKNKAFYHFINATLFSLAHLFLMNPYVLLMTFVGGWMFSLTFEKSRSLLIICIEHALYGLWLFTLGLGEFIAFPVPG